MKWVVVAVLVVACGPPDTAASSRAIVYGADDRVEAFEAGEPWLTLARERSVALTRAPTLDAEGSWVGPRLGDRAELCRDERFLDQIAPARCSGVLIDAETVLTAGHCLSEGCAGLSVVRGFMLGEDGPLPVRVASCRALVRQRRLARLDYALITLDAPVPGVAPLTVATATVGARVVSVGHPLGLPAKVDRGGTISELDATAFTTDLDLYEGGSGSGVFDRAGRLLGIAARGQSDFVFDPQGACLRTRTASVGREIIIRADAVLADRTPVEPAPIEDGGCQAVGGASSVAVLAVLLGGMVRRRRGRGGPARGRAR